MSRARLGLVAAVAVLAVLLVAVGGSDPPQRDGRPFDPASEDPGGTLGLVRLLERFGADVRRTNGTVGPADDLALVLADRLDPAARDELRAWVRDGGRLVVADPVSDLLPFAPAREAADPPALGLHRPGTCDLAALADVRGLLVTGDRPLRVPPGAGSCFGDGRSAQVVAVREGAGVIVGVATPEWFVNANLASPDQAVLAVALLAPTPGERVALVGPVPGGGDDTLVDLVPTRVWQFLVLAALAFVLFAVSRARRLGAPVVEAVPVEVPGAELVEATGRLLARSREPWRTAALLRRRAARVLADRGGLRPDDPPEQLAAVAASAGLDPAHTLDLLTRPCSDDTELARLARDLDDLVRRLGAVPSAGGPR